MEAIGNISNGSIALNKNYTNKIYNKLNDNYIQFLINLLKRFQYNIIPDEIRKNILVWLHV